MNFFFSGKTLNYLKSKVDGSSSQSLIFPTIDEIKSWNEKMDNVLENKHGLTLFSEFLAKEYSTENLEFVLKCREYKKLFIDSKKNQKKIKKLADEIYENFLNGEKLNLDCIVKAATIQAYNEKELQEDTFSLAQIKIEHLLSTDKYGRFLQSPQVKNLMENAIKGSQISIQSANGEIHYSEDVNTTPIVTQNNEDTPIAPQNRTLRSASAIENGTIQTITE